MTLGPFSRSAHHEAQASPGAAAHPTLTDVGKRPPFSFSYDGTPSSQLLPRWRKTESTRKAPDGRRVTTIVWTDPGTGLRVRFVSTEYSGFPTVSWVVNFENAGSEPTPVLSDVLCLDLSVDKIVDNNWLIHTVNGSDNKLTDFKPFDLPLQPDTFRTFTARGGRPTSGSHSQDLNETNIAGSWPYYNIDWTSGGLIAALGWPGQWAVEIKRTDDQRLHLLGGMATMDGLGANEEIWATGLTDVWLDPGESIRTPLTVLLPWKGGEWVDAQNTWRRWMVECHMPKVNGQPVPPLCPSQANDYFPGSIDTVDDELQFVNAYGSNNATAGTGGVHDHWWIDAGWYENGSTPDWYWVGTWEPDSERFPQGLGPVTDRARELGMSAIVWFEPERVSPGTWLYENHPEWLLRSPGSAPNSLLDFGNPEAREWAIEHFSRLIDSQGADVYREDFNMDILGFWNEHDAPADSASREFSDVQGANGWRYQDKVGDTWQDIQTYTDYGYQGQRQWHDDTGGFVWPGRMHPGPSNDTALAWAASEAATVDVTGRVSKAPDPRGNGVVVRITKNEEPIWGPTTIEGSDTVGVDANISAVDVAPGDILRFELNANGDWASDATAWDPRISYGVLAPRRRGMTQIRHVEGRLAYWAALLERHPGLVIDTCASGGRRLDVQTLQYSINLLRSDYVMDATANQCHNYGISFWVPMSGDAVRITGSTADTYNARSAMAPSFHEALDARDPNADWTMLRQMSQEWKDIASAYHGAYYPLTRYSTAPNAWMAWQFHQPDRGGGFLQAFRRPTSTQDELRLRLRGLTDRAQYTLSDYQTGRTWVASGKGLMGSGILITLPDRPSATTITYKVQGD